MADPRSLAILESWRAAGMEARAEFAVGEAWPRAVWGIRLRPGGLRPGSYAGDGESGAARAALAFLAEAPDLLGIRPAELSAPAVLSGRDHFTARFEQIHPGASGGRLPVLGGGVVVQLDAGGTVTSVSSSLVRGLRPPSTPSIDASEAFDVAGKKLGRLDPPLTSRLAAARLCGRDRLVWDLRLRAGGRPWRVLVDALEGMPLGAGDLLRRADCAGVPPPRGLAFAMSPADGPARLRDLPSLDCRSLSLSGDWARVHEWIGEDPWNGDPLFELEEDGRAPEGRDGGVVFDEPGLPSIARANVYLHSTLVHDYLAGLGFHGLDRPFPAVVNARACSGLAPCETAWYDPLFPYATGPGLMVFGSGPSLNLGLDGGLVYHEYLHAAIDRTAGLGDDFFDPDLFFSLALGEGFADYFSASFAGDPRLGRYAAAGGPAGEPARSLAEVRRWPEGIEFPDPHATGLIWGGCLWEIRQAFSGGGADRAGVEQADRLAYACLTSLPATSDLLRAGSALLAGAAAGRLSPEESLAVKESLGRRGLVQAGPAPPPVLEALRQDGEARGESPAGRGDPRLAPVEYRVEAPEDGMRLVLDLESEGPGALGLHARHGSPVGISAGTLRSDASAEAPGLHQNLVIDAASTPPLAAGPYFIAITNRGAAAARYRLAAALSRGTAADPRPIAPGEEVTAVLAGNAADTLQYTLEARDPLRERLEISVSSPSGEIELLARHGAPVAAEAGGEALADLSARIPAGGAASYLDRLTLPSLLPGAYYLQLRNRSPDPARATLRAALVPVPPARREEIPLAPGEHAEGTVGPAPRGARLLHLREYAVAIPGDAARLRVSLATRGDLGLYARWGTRVEPEGRQLLFDHSSRIASSDGESLSIDLSAPPRGPGTYYLALLNHASEEAAYELSVEIESAPAQGTVIPLENGTWSAGSAEGSGGFPAGGLARVQYSFQSDGAGGLDAVLSADGPGDLDLYLRRGRPVEMIGGNVVADFRAVTERGAEAITVLPGGLASGDYYLAIVNRSVAAVPFRILAASGPDALSVPARSGETIEGSLAAAPGPPLDCAREDRQIVVEVPAAAVRLEAGVTASGGGPLQILMRRGARVVRERESWIHDREADSRDGPLVVEGADLHPGLYFFAVSNCQAEARRYLVEVLVEVPSRGTIPLEDGKLLEGVAAPASPGGPALHGSQYAIDLPPGSAELALAAWGGGCAELDVDLYVGLGAPVEIDREGRTNARWRAQRAGAGGELLALTGASDPPLVPGRYYLAILNRERAPAGFSVGASASPVASLALAPGGSSAAALTSGQTGLGFLHPVQYRFEVFPGAESLALYLSGEGDLDLLLRFGLPVARDGSGRVLADQGSSTPGPAPERISLAGELGCLRPGTYYAAVGNFEDHPVTFNLRSEVRGFPAILARIGQTLAGSAPGAEAGRLEPVTSQVRLIVPPGGSGFQAELIAEDPASNLDLFMRQGEPVEFGAAIAATYRSEGGGGIEAIAVPASRIVPGPYYVAVASRAPAPVAYALRFRPLSLSVRELGVGAVEPAVAPPSSAAGIGWLAPEQFRVQVGGEALWIGLVTGDRESPLELHLRAARPVEAEGTGTISDRSSTGPGAVKTLRLAALSPGEYYLAVRSLRSRDEPFLIESGAAPWALRGDADESGEIDLTDAVAILLRLFLAGPPVCIPGADADDSASLDLTDAVYLLDYLYLAGPPPALPFPDCAPARGTVGESCSGAGCGS
jgi:hypothetical protein